MSDESRYYMLSESEYDSDDESPEIQWENVEIENKDLEGPNSKYVELIGNDDRSFIVKREIALLSPTIKIMVSGPIKHKVNSIKFRSVSGDVLNYVCCYLAHKAQGTINKSNLPFHIRPSLSLDLLIAAVYFEC